MNKWCFKCDLNKSATEYYPSQYVLEYGKCKACFKKYYEKNKNNISAYKKEYAILNSESLIKKRKAYHKKNKKHLSDYKQQWYQKNKEKILFSRKEYIATKYHNDPHFKMRANVSLVIRKSLKKNGTSKNGKSILQYLPYSIQELKDHLEKQFEPWMNWQNWKKYNINTWDDNDPSTWAWNIDHIIPQAQLLFSSMEDENFKKCWGLSNLRPLSAKQNISDNARKGLS